MLNFLAKTKKEEEEEEHSIKSSLYLQENQLRDDGGESSLGLTRISDDTSIKPNREKLFRFKIVSNFHFKFKHKTNSFNLPHPHAYDDDNKRLKWILCCIDLFLGCIVGCLVVFVELFRNPNTQDTFVHLYVCIYGKPCGDI